MIGPVDPGARLQVDADLLSFTVPWRMFQELEGNVHGSFLERETWREVRARSA